MQSSFHSCFQHFFIQLRNQAVSAVTNQAATTMPTAAIRRSI